MNKLNLTKKDALIVVDVQNDFCPSDTIDYPDGSLAVAGALDIIPIINAVAKEFDTVVVTQDWHPENHISFATTHDSPMYSSMNVSYGEQVMWPEHCVQGSYGAELRKELDIPHTKLIIRKGCNPAVDSYSAFIEADGTLTGLSGYLKENGIENVYVVGIATDFCVSFTAIDATKLGFNVTVIENGCKGIDLQNTSLEIAWKSMAEAGVKRINY